MQRKIRVQWSHVLEVTVTHTQMPCTVHFPRISPLANELRTVTLKSGLPTRGQEVWYT